MSKTSSWPLLLIAFAIVGAGVSYHFTLDARFAALDQKLEQNSIALQQFQIAQESAASSKNAALDGLNKEVDALAATLAPIGKSTKDQTDALAQIRRQIATLGQLQQAQQDAQKKLADYAGQLDKIKHDVQLHEAQASSTASTTAPVPPTVPLPTSAPTPAPAPAPAVKPTTSLDLPTNHPTIADLKPSVTPLTETSSVDLRPADITAPRDNAVRALPVALPVDTALSDNR
jgi:cell division protein FtsN